MLALKPTKANQMKKLVFRKVKIVKEVPVVDLTRWFSPRQIAELRKGKKNPKRKSLSERLQEKKESDRLVKWFVFDKSTREELARFDSYDQAKHFCIKNDYDFGQYL